MKQSTSREVYNMDILPASVVLCFTIIPSFSYYISCFIVFLSWLLGSLEVKNIDFNIIGSSDLFLGSFQINL